MARPLGSVQPICRRAVQVAIAEGPAPSAARRRSDPGPPRFARPQITSRTVGPFLDCGRKAGLAFVGHNDLAAVEAFKGQCVDVVMYQRQAPIAKKAPGRFKGWSAVRNLVNARLRSCLFLFMPLGRGVTGPRRPVRLEEPPTASGSSFVPQYRLFCSMYCKIPARPFSRPRPESRQPPKGVGHGELLVGIDPHRAGLQRAAKAPGALENRQSRRRRQAHTRCHWLLPASACSFSKGMATRTGPEDLFLRGARPVAQAFKNGWACRNSRRPSPPPCNRHRGARRPCGLLRPRTGPAPHSAQCCLDGSP